MKKMISRRNFLTAAGVVAAAGVLTACGGSGNAASSAAASESASVSSEAVSSAASADETGTHTVIDHGGNEVEVPNKVTRVVIDQIPILSTYMAYFEGSATYIVGYCGSFKSVISDTVLKNIAPELMESSDTVYAQSDLNIEEIMKLNPDVILYNAGNSSHAEILKASGIPSIGFATVGASTEADPLERYEEWLKLLEDVFGEPGKTEAFVAAGDEIVADVEARIADIPESDRPSALILWKYSDGVPQVSGNGTFGTYWMKHLGVTDKALEATGFAQTSMEQVYGHPLPRWPRPAAPAHGECAFRQRGWCRLLHADRRAERPRVQHHPRYVELVHPEPGCPAGTGMAGLQHLPGRFRRLPAGRYHQGILQDLVWL